MDNESQKTTTSYAVIAIVAALGVLGVVVVVAVMTIPAAQEAEAGCERGSAGSHAFNQSKGRCLDRGTF
jgi:hypothetical protein